ncbi:autotransporter outer membrane beta-barrel domain-containing protein [Bosea sp. 2YAB26]|uniref:autotransporter family protein n=1 Tax=Bosea sp. 2YAB26 TaxID=3237478 RepID=UPI003F90BA4D
MLSGAGVKRRKLWLLAASALTPLFLGISGGAALAQTCGALDGSNSATCTSAGNDYPGGINYSTNNTPILVTLQPGVRVVIPNGSGVVDSVNLANTTGPIGTPGANATLTVDGAFIDNTAVTGPNKSGLRIQASGSAIITATNTEVHVTGLQSTNAIWAIVLPSSTLTTAATVNYNGPGVTSIGTDFSTVIQADNRGSGPATIEATGDMTGIALGAGANGITGLFASGGSSGTVLYHGGSIAVRGNFANGIYAAGNTAIVTTDPGTTITVLSLTGERLKPGIALDSFGTAAANDALIANVASTIQMAGPAAPDPGLRNNGYGIRAFSFLDAPISVNYTGPGITTFGGNGMGIVALSGGGSVNVTSSGPITTHGSGAVGIFVDSTNLVASSPSEFRPTPVFTGVPTGTVQVNATNVLTTGQFSSGIVAKGARDVTVNVAPGGSIMGGWQADLTGGSSLFGLPAAGVVLSSTGGIATLINDGSIGALSDRAVLGDPVIINNGTMTGFVTLSGVNSYINNGAFNLRHFADTNGDSLRDTVRVAVSDLGGPGSTFANNGTLALLGAPGATTLDSTGQYLPQGNVLNAMTLGGPLQGQLIGVHSFVNSGVIDLQANPVAGDVLTITGARTAGAFGGGVFTSNGGSLRLDSVLDSGEPSHSDVLVVDGSNVGAGGATSILVRNAGGLGALTPGNGILVVDVPAGGGSTQPGTFALGGPAVAGPYEYSLFRGGVAGAAPAPDSWFLRSTLAPPEPIQPGSGPTPAPPNSGIPNFRREVSLYAALPAMGLTYGRTLIDSLHERVGELHPLALPAVTEERTIWCKNPEKNFRCTTTVQLPAGASVPGNTYASAGWARIIGQHGNQDGGPWGIFRNGPNYDYDIYAFQAGLDLYRSLGTDGSRNHAGLYAAIGRIEGDVTHFNGIKAGTNTIDGYSLGAYWTHFGPSGWYLDGVVQGTWYDAEADSKRLFKLKRDGFGFAASLEGGYPLQLGNGFILEPQAQMIYQTLANGSGRDEAALVRFSDADSLAGRIGARLAKSWTLEEDPRAKPRLLTAWLKASLWNEFLGDPKTSFSSATGLIPFHADLGGSWAELRTGVDAQISRNTALYASAGYSIGLNGRSRAYDGRLGIKVSW